MDQLDRAEPNLFGTAPPDPDSTPGEWVRLLMDFTIGTGIVLWHMMIASAMEHPEQPIGQPEGSRDAE